MDATPGARQEAEARRSPPADPLKALSAAALAGVIAGLYLALIYAPTDTLQGEVQRIFYLHLAAFGGAFVGFGCAVIGGIAYLRSRRPGWDMLAHAGVEVGLALAAINVLTGAIYARPIVNSWWTWDPKLTAVTIMALTYAAYLMLRHSVESPERRRAFASVYGVLAFATVLNTFMVIRLRPDTLHEAMFGPGASSFAMPAPMQTALLVNVVVWSGLVAPALIAWRLRLERSVQTNERLHLEMIAGD